MKNSMSFTSHIYIPTKNRRCMFSASAKRLEGEMEWSVTVVADYVATEQFSSSNPIQLIAAEFARWTAGIK